MGRDIEVEPLSAEERAVVVGSPIGRFGSDLAVSSDELHLDALAELGSSVGEQVAGIVGGNLIKSLVAALLIELALSAWTSAWPPADSSALLVGGLADDLLTGEAFARHAELSHFLDSSVFARGLRVLDAFLSRARGP